MAYKALVNKVKYILNNKGQGMTEYVLILGLIALAVIASLAPFGQIIADKFSDFTAIINNS